MMQTFLSVVLLLLLLPCRPAGAQPRDAADQWQWAPSRLPRALLAEGLWTDTFRLREAVHAAGVPYEAGYKSRSAYWRPQDRIIGLPKDAAAFRHFAVVVLSNVDAVSLTGERIAVLERFVRNGGGLVVLGGYWAYSRGGYADTELEKMLPVTFPPENRIPPVYAGARLAMGREASWTPQCDFSDAPCAFFVQRLEPREGARVELLAGDRPAFVSGSYGKGRVAACALTANGAAPEGVLPFWEWADWPRLLGHAIRWAAGGRPLEVPALPCSDGGPLTAGELDDLALGMDVPEALVKRAVAHPTRENARALFDAVWLGEGRRRIGLARVSAALLPFAGAGWAERLIEATDAFNPDRDERRAALSLLGACGAPAGYPVLVKAVEDPDVREAALDGLGLLGDKRAIPLVRGVFDHAMQAARSEDAPQHLDPDLFAAEYGHTAAHAAVALYRLGEDDGVSRAADMFARMHLYNRIFRNAGKRRVRDTDPVGVERVKQIWARARQLKATQVWLESAAGPVPESQRQAFLTFAATAGDAAHIEWVLAAMEQSAARFPPETWTPLHDARDGIVSAMARALSSGPE